MFGNKKQGQARNQKTTDSCKFHGRDTAQNSNAHIMAATASDCSRPGNCQESERAFYGGHSPRQPTGVTRSRIPMRILWRPQPAPAHGRDTAQKSNTNTTAADQNSNAQGAATTRASPRPRIQTRILGPVFHGRDTAQNSNACVLWRPQPATAHGRDTAQNSKARTLAATASHSLRQPTAVTQSRIPVRMLWRP